MFGADFARALAPPAKVHTETSNMSGLPKVPSAPLRSCPFCGVATEVPHETQVGCIAALHSEIGRMRDILATLRPAGVQRFPEPADQSAPAAIRLAID